MRLPIIKALATGLLALGLAACEDASDGVTSIPSFDFRVVHASADAPNVNIELDGSPVALNVAFKQATQLVSYRGVGSLSVKVDGLVPGGVATVIGPVNLTFDGDTAYTVIAVGSVASIEPVVISNPRSAVPAGSVRAQVVHAAAGAPEVDVYVTTPGADLTQSAPLGRFEFKGSLGPVEIPAGDYQIRVTLPADPNAVVFDSGTVALASGSDLLIVAVDNTGPGDAPISLVVATGRTSSEILDQATPAGFRVIHASPDAPPVDVIVDDGAPPLLESVPFPAFSDYFSVPAGTYNVKVTAENNPGAIVINADLALAAGAQYSVYAAGLLGSIEPYVLVDDNRSIATEARVRIVHLAPTAGLVDVYVTAPGADINAATPAFTNVDFKAETGYVSLAAGAYDVTVTVAGTKTAAIGPATITLDAGGVYTAAARDVTGGGAFGLILLDDFN